MMKKSKLILFFCLSLCTAIFSQHKNEEQQIRLLTLQEDFEIGSTIALDFETKFKKGITLYCANSYGSILVNPTTTKNGISFRLPYHFTKKRGVINWKVFQNSKLLMQGNINLNSKKESSSLEMYLGPPSIEAGGRDYTMLVTIPTDSLDNPLAENTLLNVNTQFLDNENQTNIYVNNLVAHLTIYSPSQSGRMLISTNHNQKNSTELSVDIIPSLSKNFQIFAARNHEYADGNQITTFFTSTLKDENNNIVSDGTFVYFYITDDNNHVLKTFGQTINGVARAKMIHPEKATNWTVKAYVIGIAESNSIFVSYKQAIKNFAISLSKNNTVITAGPFQSFMNQMIPDGLKVKLTILQNEEIIKVYYKETQKGFTNFILNKNVYKPGNYTITVEVAGLIKKIEKVSL